MVKQILVLLDGSPLAECALPHVTAMAHAFNAQVNLLLLLLEQPSTFEAAPIHDPLAWQLRKTEADLYVGEIKSRLEQTGLRVEKDLLECRSTEQILKFAHDKRIDLIIINSHEQLDRGLGSWNVGWIDEQVLQHGRISTLVVRTSQSFSEPQALTYRRLLIPLDGSRRAESVLPFVATLMQAQLGESEALLVHVVSKPETPRRLPLTVEDTELVNCLLERNREEGRAYLKQLQSRLLNNTRTILAISDNVAATLQGVAEREQCDLMILSAHGYSGEARWPHGSLTDRFITDGTLPLLIVQDLPGDILDVPRVEYVPRLPEHY